MIFLLDVNALIALGLFGHVFHERVRRWASGPAAPKLATCPITELGFLRILCQARGYGLTLTHAQSLLGQLKGDRGPKLQFLADDQDAAQLPDWVETAAQITDGHLMGLAWAQGVKLATLDEHIPGAFVIPL